MRSLDDIIDAHRSEKLKRHPECRCGEHWHSYDPREWMSYRRALVRFADVPGELLRQRLDLLLSCPVGARNFCARAAVAAIEGILSQRVAA